MLIFTATIESASPITASGINKGGGNLTCVPRQDIPGERGARKKLKVREKLKVRIKDFPKSPILWNFWYLRMCIFNHFYSSEHGIKNLAGDIAWNQRPHHNQFAVCASRSVCYGFRDVSWFFWFSSIQTTPDCETKTIDWIRFSCDIFSSATHLQAETELWFMIVMTIVVLSCGQCSLWNSGTGL